MCANCQTRTARCAKLFFYHIVKVASAWEARRGPLRFTQDVFSAQNSRNPQLRHMRDPKLVYIQNLNFCVNI